MAVTVVKTPQGHKIIDQALEVSVSNSGGDALFTYVYHGLGTGDYIYITSDVDEYTGFWYVTVIDSNTFKISDGSGGDFAPFYRALEGGSGSQVEYYQTNEHEWVSIFLPIVYKASNNLWPVNSVDTARTVSASADDNGYTSLTLSGDLKASFNALEYVKIAGASDSDLNGVWQIIEVIGLDEIVIDLPYSASNSFAGATVQYYYNNYQVRVKIYGGLPAGHPWESQKPYTEIGELSLTPDENNIIMFSISDYLRGNIAIRNNPTVYSMPINVDAFTGFYIATAESYDQADGYTVSTYEGSFVDDSYEGFAVAGKLPFKNIYSGDYSDYVYTDGSPAKWLTMLDRLLAVEDKYFDVSFIKNQPGLFTVVEERYIADYLVQTVEAEYDDAEDDAVGVYRIVLQPDATYDYYIIYVKSASDVVWTEEIRIDILESCEAQSGFSPADIRLLEDGSYRLLE